MSYGIWRPYCEYSYKITAMMACPLLSHSLIKGQNYDVTSKMMIIFMSEGCCCSHPELLALPLAIHQQFQDALWIMWCPEGDNSRESSMTKSGRKPSGHKQRYSDGNQHLQSTQTLLSLYLPKDFHKKEFESDLNLHDQNV